MTAVLLCVAGSVLPVFVCMSVCVFVCTKTIKQLHYHEEHGASVVLSWCTL